MEHRELPILPPDQQKSLRSGLAKLLYLSMNTRGLGREARLHYHAYLPELAVEPSLLHEEHRGECSP
jgi:hypothetical protein